MGPRPRSVTMMTMTTISKPPPEYLQAIYWHARYEQAGQRAEMLERELLLLRTSYQASCRRQAEMTMLLIQHGLPVPALVEKVKDDE